MDEIAEHLHFLVKEACKHPVGSAQRQKNLTTIIRITSKKLWRENTPDYEDALQQTWIYFCQNICEGNTGEPYNPARGSVITWLNFYLKRRLQDFYISSQKQQARTATSQFQRSKSGEVNEIIDPVDRLEANPDIPPLLAEIKTWVETDRNGDLRRTYIQGHPRVNCQVLILRRLPPETDWKALAAEFGLSVSTLSSFYQRQCMPRLRKFGELEGYL